jgi:hypothetical protein
MVNWDWVESTKDVVFDFGTLFAFHLAKPDEL